jgi:hypothetical protein
MKALAFALSCGVVISGISVVKEGVAQSARPTVQVIAISGGAYVLPRQAGSKDAPDVFLAAPPSAAGKGFPEKEIAGVVKQPEISGGQRGR